MPMGPARLREHLHPEWGMIARVDGVAKRIEDGSDFSIDGRIVTPDIAKRQRDVFGESTGAVDSYTLCVGTKMTATREAVAAASTNHVTFSADDFAGVKIVHVRTDVYDFAAELVADRHGNRDGGARPFVPVVNVKVCTADTGIVHPDQDIVDANLRFGYLFEPQALLASTLHQSSHRFPSHGKVNAETHAETLFCCCGLDLGGGSPTT